MGDSSSALPVKEGSVPFHHPSLPADKPCHTWYKIVGDLSTSKRPLITLHGGPGACHNYLLSLSLLTKQYSVPVVFYDQLGNGNSTHLREKRLDTTFWTPELFMAELENLLTKLGIKEYDLLGQSWGGMLGSMWAIRRPKGLRRLVISNSPSSMKLWVEACDYWRRELPREIDETIARHEAQKSYEDPAYKEAVLYFYKRHLCRVPGTNSDPFPKDAMDSLNQLEADDTVYFTMNGPSEFTVVGNLKTWDVRGELHKIEVPTLILNGEWDEARDSCVYPFFTQIPHSKWLTLSGTSHMGNIEDPERYCGVVGEFLGQ